jgi:hypothetical protein
MRNKTIVCLWGRWRWRNQTHCSIKCLQSPWPCGNYFHFLYKEQCMLNCISNGIVSKWIRSCHLVLHLHKMANKELGISFVELFFLISICTTSLESIGKSCCIVKWYAQMVYLPFVMFTDFSSDLQGAFIIIEPILWEKKPWLTVSPFSTSALVLLPHHQSSHMFSSLEQFAFNSDVMFAWLIVFLYYLVGACLCLGFVVTVGSGH